MSTQDTDLRQAITKRFLEILWHDSKLIDYQIIAQSNSHFSTVTLSLELRSDLHILKNGSQFVSARLSFQDSRCIRIEMDFVSKSVCSDDIFEASCEENSEWKHQISREQGGDDGHPSFSLKEMLHFKIHLCTPGGDIDILARDFRLDILE